MKTKIRNRPKIFFDFDNTITTFDVLDSIVERFSKDGAWKLLEKRWKLGEIGSRECLKGQVEGIRVTRPDLDRHLAKVKIDPYFKPILEFLRAKKIEIAIVSDNFDYILNRILRNNKIAGLDVYSNKLTFSRDRLIPEFPFTNSSCGDCGNCKEKVLMDQSGPDTKAFYVGDGLSDRCASKAADVVFAKGRLKKYLKEDGVPYIPFDGLKDVYKHLKETL